MPTGPGNASFGELLRLHREKTVERRIGKHLSQERLARKLSEKTGLHISRNNVNGWETNRKTIPVNDRRMLVAIMTVLHEYGGLTSVEEADHLLEGGDYRSLNELEIAELRLPGKPANQISSQQNGMIQPDRILDDSSSSRGVANSKPAEPVELFSTDCGSAPINLAQQRLLVSTSFGSYFTGLLERPGIYLDLETQIDCPALKHQDGLRPLQRIFWLLESPKGPRTLIIGGEGGMGKSILSAKIIRCLYQEEAFDMLLGDSAKGEEMTPLSREVVQHKPRFYDPETFYKRLCGQLGLPALAGKEAVNAIRDRLVGRKAVIMVDNLETVSRGDEILLALKSITSRDVRAIVTTRQITNLSVLGNNFFIVQLNPLTDPKIAGRFLLWHIEQYQHQHPALQGLREDINRNAKWLIDRTGGIPLLMQLVLSGVARYSWNYVETLPSLFGKALLEFLYRQRWDDLGRQGEAGNVSRQLLKWIAREQPHSKPITSKEISGWAGNHHHENCLTEALSLLLERFMVINRDPLEGHFSIYPSLAEFANNQPS